jgi:N-methylhydantoinase B
MKHQIATDPIRLEVFKHLFASIAEEMGVVLRKASYSPNIKERRDFSCAVFDKKGMMISQAAHIPVHLGSMPLSVTAAIEAFTTEPHSNGICPGDMVILNDPYHGGTHLPDITLITPVFVEVNAKDRVLAGYVASRAHHADVGGSASGSMSISRELYQEGIIIPPIKLFQAGELNNGVLDLILANVRTPGERLGDLWAQIASNQRGVTRFSEIIQRYGEEPTGFYMQALIAYSELMTRHLLESLPDGEYSFVDYLDDDGINEQNVPIAVKITIKADEAIVDFTGSAPQVQGSLNAVYAITLSAVNYVFRCLAGLDTPNNAGCMIPIKVLAPRGSVVNAAYPAAVAGGNVETSQRIVDVLFGALARACPERIPAASQGTMNNVTIGGWDDERNHPFTYYETIGGGMGARPDSFGPSAMHSHMTNTLNTPVEALEYAYPLQVIRYEIRRGSGGKGRFWGGHGIRRDIQAMGNTQVSLISERRRLPPYGLAGGSPGQLGANYIVRNNEEVQLPGKGTFELKQGDVLSIRTPGGGGFGSSGELTP